MDNQNIIAVAVALGLDTELDAADNLLGALLDIERLTEQGSPVDKICLETVVRVFNQLIDARVTLRKSIGSLLEPATTGAAAPELLEALQQARSFVDLCWNEESGEEAADAKYVLDRVDAAIAKATGAAKEGE